MAIKIRTNPSLYPTSNLRLQREGREWLDSSQRVAPLFDARSILSVREHGLGETCLRACASKSASARRREAAFSLRSYFGEGGPAKAGNAGGGFFQHSQHCDRLRADSFQPGFTCDPTLFPHSSSQAGEARV
jgi:hypothetical protein